MSLTTFETEEERDERVMQESRAEALAEYPAHKREQEQEECPHDELDHGICMDCGKDCFDDVVAAAEFASDCAMDR
jgi:hypothetical protein